MLPINANPAVNRNDYIMINPDINHQGHNMGNGVISTPNQGVNAQNGQNSIVPAPVYVNPSANSNQGLVNSQTQPITTPITSDANLQGGVITTPEYNYDGIMRDNSYFSNDFERAKELGYDRRIPAQKLPFDSHGQPGYFDGKNYITPDVDGHSATNGWKMFNKKGKRQGTFDNDLNFIRD
jgi:filamentous hemagglutinin